MGIIVCIANNKGGIGKTSVTCHLGAALALRNQQVLVIDLDSQCNASGIMLPKNALVHHTLYELLDPDSADIPVESCIYPTEYKNLYCLPNVEEASGLELDLAEGYPLSLRFLRDRAREHARARFDVTLIDCPPTVGLVTASALFAADQVIIPVDAGSAQSLHGLKKVLDLISSVRDSGNPGLGLLRLLINRVDKRTSISRIIEKDVVGRFTENKVFAARIPACTAFEQAEYAKETVFLNKTSSRGARAYKSLAREFLHVVKEKNEKNKKNEKKVINGTQKFGRQDSRIRKCDATGTG